MVLKGDVRQPGVDVPIVLLLQLVFYQVALCLLTAELAVLGDMFPPGVTAPWLQAHCALWFPA